MKKKLVLEFDKEEKDILKKASTLMNDYCKEIEECEEDCPFYELCVKIQEGDKSLNLPNVFTRTKYIIK